MNVDVQAYNESLESPYRNIADALYELIEQNLPDATCKIWHGHPVWFLSNNPTVGYSQLKGRIRLLFWSGADFSGPKLEPGSGKFKDAHIDYTDVDEIQIQDIKHWIQESRSIQWNYRDIIKHKGNLERLSP